MIASKEILWSLVKATIIVFLKISNSNFFFCRFHLDAATTKDFAKFEQPVQQRINRRHVLEKRYRWPNNEVPYIIWTQPGRGSFGMNYKSLYIPTSIPGLFRSYALILIMTAVSRSRMKKILERSCFPGQMIFTIQIFCFETN